MVPPASIGSTPAATRFARKKTAGKYFAAEYVHISAKIGLFSILGVILTAKDIQKSKVEDLFYRGKVLSHVDAGLITRSM